MRRKPLIALALLPLMLLAPLLYLASWRPHKIPSDSSQSEIWMSPASSIAYGPSGDLFCNFIDGPIKTYHPGKQSWESFKIPPTKTAQYRGQLERSMSRLDFSSDGKTLFAPIWINESSMTIGAFDTKSRRLLYSFGELSEGISAISLNGKWAAFAVGGGLGIIDLTAKPENPPEWLSKRAIIATKYREYPSQFRSLMENNFFGNVNSLAFSRDSKTLAVGFNDKVAIFDVTGDLKKPRFGPISLNTPNPQPRGALMNAYDSGSPYWLEWSPDGSKLAVYDRFGLFIFDSKLQKRASVALDRTRAPLTSSLNISSNIVWAKDGKTLLTGGYLISRWSLTATDNPNRNTLKLEANYNASGPVALSPDERYLLTNPPRGERKEGIWRWKLP